MQPQERLKSISKAVSSLQYRENPFLRDFGLKIDESMMRIKARMLDPPTLVFGGNERIQPRDGGWSMMRKRLYSAPALETFAIIGASVRSRSSMTRAVFHPPNRAPTGMEQVLQQFIVALISSGREVGLEVGMTSPEIIYSGAYGREAVRDAFVQVCWRGFQRSRAQAGMRTHAKCQRLPQMILCVLPNKSAEL